MSKWLYSPYNRPLDKVLRLFYSVANLPPLQGRFLMMNIRSWFSAVVAAALVGSLLAPALTVQASGAITPGTVVALQGTPHLWVADAQGVLHWGGDTRAPGRASGQLEYPRRSELGAIGCLPARRSLAVYRLGQGRRSDLFGQVGDRMGRAAVVPHSIYPRCRAVRDQRQQLWRFGAGAAGVGKPALGSRLPICSVPHSP